ncbi:IS110 family transposase [Mucilaginibacter sp. SP1R1]|uniref:IS110 family transposase n=1 Tax=Mucilaginibacter sp. SP1R1 TaxID=2723091 RepID=UPI001609EE38|nr:IS110 family transposase [Mucilaginibacter sp. SP1R1]MBB6152805.1 transposase [Mucilaginibacter sp. SP1R1]
MKKALLKQVVGIDVAQKELVVSLGKMDQGASTYIYAYKAFVNNEKGFTAMILWVKKQTDADSPLRYVMEATGVYHEAVAYFLSDKAYSVSIVMPNKITNFFRTLETKTVTDKSMSEAIALFGLEKKVEDWIQPKKVFRELRQITRERDQLIAERTILKNQLHAEQVEAYPSEQTIGRIKIRIKMVDGQLKETLAEITAAIKNDTEIGKSVNLLTSIPGIGLLTAAVIMAETNGFELIRSKKQLTSYAGLDVKEKESGTSVKGKPRISKRGNRHLRKAMYMPALSAIRHSERYKAIFVRIVSRTSIKMKGAVAVQRKLLEMTYTIYKTQTPYLNDYLKTQIVKDPALNS